MRPTTTPISCPLSILILKNPLLPPLLSARRPTDLLPCPIGNSNFSVERQNPTSAKQTRQAASGTPRTTEREDMRFQAANFGGFSRSVADVALIRLRASPPVRGRAEDDEQQNDAEGVAHESLASSLRDRGRARVWTRPITLTIRVESRPAGSQRRRA